MGLQEEDNSSKMQLLCQELALWINSFSSWGIAVDGTEADTRIMNTVTLTIDRLIGYCRLNENKLENLQEDAVEASIPAPNRANQIILRKLDLDKTIFKAFGSIEIPADDPRGVAWQIHCRINELICAFVRLEPDNQTVIFNNAITHIMGGIGLGTVNALTMLALFGGNSHLSTTAEATSLIWTMGAKLHTSEVQTDKIPDARFYLEFFAEIVAPNDVPIRENQDAVLDMFDEYISLKVLYDEGFDIANEGLTDSDKDELGRFMIKLHKDEPDITREVANYKRARKQSSWEMKKMWDTRGHEVLRGLVKQFDPAAAKAVRTNSDVFNAKGVASCQVEYHLKFCEAIQSVCKGMHTRNELKTYRMFPFKRIMAVLLDPIIKESCFELKTVYLKLLTTAYLETDLEQPKPLFEEDLLWWFFEMAVIELQEAADNIEPYMKGAGSDYIFDGVLTCFATYFTCIHNPEVVYTRIQEDTMNKVRTLVKEIHAKPEIKGNEIYMLCCEKLMSSMGIQVPQGKSKSSLFARRVSVRPDSDKTDLEKLIAAINNDPRMVELVSEETEGAAQTLINGDRLTNPYDPDYMYLRELGDEMADSDNRTNVITFRQIVKRITDHIDVNPFSESCTEMLEIFSVVIDQYLPSNQKRDPITFQLYDQVAIDFLPCTFAPLTSSYLWENSCIRCKKSHNLFLCLRCIQKIW